MDILQLLGSLLSPTAPGATPTLAPGAAQGPTLGGVAQPQGAAVLGGAPGDGDSILGNALRGIAGSFSGGGGPGGFFSQFGRGIAGATNSADQRHQSQVRDYLLNRQISQQTAADAQKQKQAEMLAKIPPPNGMDPAQWENFKQAAPEQTLALYTQSVTPEKPKHSPAYLEYEDAQAGGYTGSFNDYQTMDANRKTPRVTNISNTNIPKAPPTIEERDQAVLLQGDPGSPEYAMAYNRTFQTPRFVPGTDAKGNPTVVPIMPTIPQGIRPPSFGGQAPAPGTDASIVVPPAGAPPGALPPTSPDLLDPNNQAPMAAAASSDAQPIAPAPAPGTPRVGPAIQVGSQPKGQTEDARKNQQLYDRAKQQLPLVLNNFDSLATLGNQVANKVPLVGNAMTSGPAQEANNALLDITASYLYSVSGATANPGEVANLAKTVMPQIGDQPQTLADKKARLQQMVDSIATRAGNAPQTAAAPQQGPTPQSLGYDKFMEGDTATNPTTKQRIIFKGGQWVPLQ